MTRFLRKFFSLMPMAVLVAAGITAWFTGYWWLVLLGLVTGGLISAGSLDDDEDAAVSVAGKTYDVKLLDQALRKRFRALLRKRDQILQVLDELKDSPVLDLPQMRAQVNELVDSYYNLVLKLERLRPFVDKKTIAVLKQSIVQLNGRIHVCSDRETKQNLTMAVENKTDELNRLLELQKHHQRIDSQLLNVVSSFNSIYTAIVQIQLSPETSGRPAREIHETISNLKQDVDISEKVVEELNAVSRVGT